MSDNTTNRYASDWNYYSSAWDAQYGTRHAHLGDEWCDDGTESRSWEQRLFAHSFEPVLTPATRLLEIGPGGGKWTVRIAPRVARVTVFDVAESMIARTRRRCEDAGLANVSYVLGNGRDMSAIPDASLDVVFSYDVFVHIALEDTVAYLQEIARILRDGGVVILHHAVNDVAPAWDRIESHNDWYRDRSNTLGQYYYYSRDAIERMYARAGFVVKTTLVDYCTMVVTAVKPADTVAPALEQALRRAATATDSAALDDAVAALAAVGDQIASRLPRLLNEVRNSPHGQARYQAVQSVRRLLRG
jgi:ubiquinone/menaquinone biosynthesis C-methylase UbiE